MCFKNCKVLQPEFRLAGILPKRNLNRVTFELLERWVGFQKMDIKGAYSKQNQSVKRDTQRGKGKTCSGNSEKSLPRVMILKTDSIAPATGGVTEICVGGFDCHWLEVHYCIWWADSQGDSYPVMHGTVPYNEVFHIPHNFWKTPLGVQVGGKKKKNLVIIT